MLPLRARVCALFDILNVSRLPNCDPEWLAGTIYSFKKLAKQVESLETMLSDYYDRKPNKNKISV